MVKINIINIKFKNYWDLKFENDWNLSYFYCYNEICFLQVFNCLNFPFLDF